VQEELALELALPLSHVKHSVAPIEGLYAPPEQARQEEEEPEGWW
jgi:hypothetical protein